jgi:predicted ester cyclase
MDDYSAIDASSCQSLKDRGRAALHFASIDPPAGTAENVDSTLGRGIPMSKVLHVTLVARTILPTLAHSESADVMARNEAVIRENLQKINRGDTRGAASDWADDAQSFGRWVGRAGVQSTLEDLLETIPDYHMDIVEMVAAGDAVVVRCTLSGTHREVGHRNEIAHIRWYTLREGKIVQQWATRDDYGLMRQLGQSPPRPIASH